MDQRGFQSFLMAGNYLSGNNNPSPAPNSDESYLNRNIFYQPLLPPHHHPYPFISSCDFFTKTPTGGEPSSESFKKPKHIHLPPRQHHYNYSFSHLPGLQSIEQINPNPRHHIRHSPSPIPPPPNKAYKLEQKIEQARKQRRTLSDKTRSLQKVLPWEKKMDMATILEETIKYIKFLQAQVTVLESMPTDTLGSNSGSNFESENRNPKVNVVGELENLNRKQLLEVVVNSPAAQTILYSKGCCIYSLEQLILFKDIAEKNFFFSDPSIFS